MKNKVFTAQVKAVSAEDGGQPGDFTATVAVFDNVDRIGDRIKSGAFDNTLKEWRASGDPIPVIMSHDWNDPFSHIGYADPNNVKSVPGKGLVVQGHLDIADNPKAAQVYRLMQRRSLKEFSFGYDIRPGGGKQAKDGAFDLTDVNLVEFGPTLKGLNPSTELTAIKSLLEAEERGFDVAEELAQLKARVDELEAKAEMAGEAGAGEEKPEEEEKPAEEESEEESEEEKPEGEENPEESPDFEPGLGVDPSGEKRDLELETFALQIDLFDKDSRQVADDVLDFDARLKEAAGE